MKKKEIIIKMIDIVRRRCKRKEAVILWNVAEVRR